MLIKVSSSAKADDPVFQGSRDGIAKLQRLDTRLEPAIGLAKRRDPGAGYDSRCPACFPPLLAQNRDREIGGGRATRQPGQVRKEAALTRSGSGRSSVSYLFCRRIAHALRPIPPGGCSAKCLFRKASFAR